MSIVQTIKKKLTKEETEKSGVGEPSAKTTRERNAKDLTEEEKKTFSAIVRKPRVTEKTAALQEKRIYAFNVAPGTSKQEVRRAVEKAYGVDVIAVRTTTIHRKRRLRGRQEGWKKGYKKAMVKIKEGQTIELSA